MVVRRQSIITISFTLLGQNDLARDSEHLVKQDSLSYLMHCIKSEPRKNLSTRYLYTILSYNIRQSSLIYEGFIRIFSSNHFCTDHLYHCIGQRIQNISTFQSILNMMNQPTMQNSMLPLEQYQPIKHALYKSIVSMQMYGSTSSANNGLECIKYLTAAQKKAYNT